MTTRIDTVRILSAIWAGVLLALTPHCGGNSEGQADDSNDGTRNNRGGSDNGGSAGSSGAPSTGGSYGGSYGGTVPCTTGVQFCFTPAEILTACGTLDGGADAGADTGADGPGEGGFGGEAGELPEFTCPSGPPYQCIRAELPGGHSSGIWNGTTCCYSYETGC